MTTLQRNLDCSPPCHPRHEPRCTVTRRSSLSCRTRRLSWQRLVAGRAVPGTGGAALLPSFPASSAGCARGTGATVRFNTAQEDASTHLPD